MLQRPGRQAPAEFADFETKGKKVHYFPASLPALFFLILLFIFLTGIVAVLMAGIFSRRKSNGNLQAE
jgi:hypothetical protein